MLLPIFTRDRYYLLLDAGSSQLWRQRGRLLETVAAFDPADNDYAAQLRTALSVHKVRTINLLLNLPDLTLQAEPTPAVGAIDRRKLIARRLDWLFPRAALKGARIGKHRVQLAALRPNPVLRSTLAATAGTDIQPSVRIGWVAHAALEALRLIPPVVQSGPFIGVLRMNIGGILIAGADGQLLATRQLSLSQLEETQLAVEIISTVAYLQRHGWRAAGRFVFIGIGVSRPSAPALVLTHAETYADADGQAELLAALALARKPLQPLDQPRLARRRRLQTCQQLLRAGALAALVLAFTGCVTGWWLIASLQDRQRLVTEAMAKLPPPLAIQNMTLLNRLQVALDAPLALAAVLPNDSILTIAYQDPPLDNNEKPALRITATAAPALAGWQASKQQDNAPISGTVGKAAGAQPTPYAYSYQVQP